MVINHQSVLNVWKKAAIVFSHKSDDKALIQVKEILPFARTVLLLPAGNASD